MKETSFQEYNKVQVTVISLVKKPPRFVCDLTRSACLRLPTQELLELKKCTTK